jgi:hypothetical protein
MDLSRTPQIYHQTLGYDRERSWASRLRRSDGDCTRRDHLNPKEFLVAIAEMKRDFVAMREEYGALVRQVRRPDRIKYCVAEAGERLGRSRSSLYQLMNAGELSAVKERGRTYITEEECQRWERSTRARTEQS